MGMSFLCVLISLLELISLLFLQLQLDTQTLQKVNFSNVDLKIGVMEAENYPHHKAYSGC